MLAPYKTDKTYLFLYGRNVLGSSFPQQSKYCYSVSSVCLLKKGYFLQRNATVPIEKECMSPKDTVSCE